ncbi:flavodoxin domain-containing protein [Nocardia sp. NPDC005366]|uniref:flavodoxin domain-containing protein n=1 Tax=Nocardia sp. NPDC005366 TaxID=3156878 RepID=UPI0033AEAEE8
MESKKTRIAVVYATAQGSTREIAEYIAEGFTTRGAEVELADVDHAPELTRFDAVVLGSAIHDMSLLLPAVDYVRNNRAALADTAVWLFSVGLGPALRGPIGRVIGRTVPPKIAAVRDSISPREYRAFAGHYERVGVSLKARVLYRLMGGGRYGDLRDWAAISGWTAAIADELGLPRTGAAIVHP